MDRAPGIGPGETGPEEQRALSRGSGSRWPLVARKPGGRWAFRNSLATAGRKASACSHTKESLGVVLSFVKSHESLSFISVSMKLRNRGN